MQGNHPSPAFHPRLSARIRRNWAGISAAGLMLFCGPGSPAQTTEPPPRIITDPAVLFSLTAREREQALPLNIEGRVSYFDPGFNMLWLEKDGLSTYVPLGTPPPPLRTGQRVHLEGRITPSKGLKGTDVTVRVIEEDAPFTPLETKDRINDLEALHARMVTTEGYVDIQHQIDAEHTRLVVIVENRPVLCWVRPDDPAHVPDWRGKFVRVSGLYSRKLDPAQTNSTIEIWVGPQAHLQVVGTLQKNSRFDKATTPINGLYLLPRHTEVLVRGRIESQQAGKSMIVRDATGLVEIHSIQEQRLPVGSEVEAVGWVEINSGRWVLDQALYRPFGGSPDGSPDGSPGSVLTTTEKIRELSAGEAGQGKPVDVRGIVIWSIPESEATVLYLQDITGGIRVEYEQAKIGPIRLGKYIRVKGTTRAGRFAPVVQMGEMSDLGSLSHPEARPITLEQALTGKEEAQWVELRGFIQKTVAEGDWRWIHVTTPAGNFTGHLLNPVKFVANPGSLIRVRGVCETKTDADGRITGVTLRVPFLTDITVEEDAPADFYNLPRQAIRDLGQLSSRPNMTRAKIAGTVLHAASGGALMIQDGDSAVLVLSQETVPLVPGDQIEAVGVLGREGVRPILREAIYRKTGTGPPPTPARLADPAHLSVANDFHLVSLRGTLIDRFDQPERTRLTLQAGRTLIEAGWVHTPGAALPEYAMGTGLELTGIYRLEYDDSRQIRGFDLQLRSPADIQVYQAARLWTLQCALIAVGLLAVCTLLGLGWISALRRRVSQQTRQIRSQLEEQARLEAELQHAARLESLGSLAGGIAHDYNNLLTIILGNLSLLKLEPRVVETGGQRLGEIERAVMRARDLTRQLLTFASGGEPQLAPVDLAAVARQATESVLMDTVVQAEFVIAPGLWPAGADRDQVFLAVQNLVRNAAQAMPGGGIVRLELANETITSGGLAHGRYVRLSITDTGEGIRAEVLPRIFDPYFTTRKGARGLGLATTYSIINRHHGRLNVVSSPGKGTTMTLWLPVAVVPEKAPPAAPPIPVAPLTGGKPRVLFMDDEESLRFLAGLVLERMGLEPTLVPNGESAVREFEDARRTGRPFALLIFDLTIVGGMGGKQAIAAIRQLDPQVPAIVSSGYSSDPVMANHASHGFQAAVTKPFDVATLGDAVRRFIPQAQPV